MHRAWQYLGLQLPLVELEELLPMRLCRGGLLGRYRMNLCLLSCYRRHVSGEHSHVDLQVVQQDRYFRIGDGTNEMQELKV